MTDVRRPDDRSEPFPPSYPPTYPPTAGWPPPPPGPPPPPRRRTGRVLAIVAAVVLGIPVLLFVIAMVAVALRGPVPPVTGPGAGAGPGQVGLLQLEPGSCFDSAPVPADGSTVGLPGVTAVPCTSPHTRQVVSTLGYPNTTWEGGGQAKASEHCGIAFRDDVRKDARTDPAYVPAIMHSIVNAQGRSSLYVACVLTTEVPRTGSVLP